VPTMRRFTFQQGRSSVQLVRTLPCSQLESHTVTAESFSHAIGHY
jgi:hypothetical protein